MKTAIQHLHQVIKETEVKLGMAKEARKVHERTLQESEAEVLRLEVLLSDCKALIGSVPAPLTALEGGKKKRA